tara:strand:+ start:5532 stop:6023 length:492 start_codon:yes stop_codon:yes gene_type:complete
MQNKQNLKESLKKIEASVGHTIMMFSKEVYIIECEGVANLSSEERVIKIGAAKCADTRRKQLQIGCPFPLKVISETRGVVCSSILERFLQNVLSEYRCIGEWFTLTPEKFQHLERFFNLYKSGYPNNTHWRYQRIPERPIQPNFDDAWYETAFCEGAENEIRC